MKSIAKVILSTLVGLVLWAVFGILFWLILAALLTAIKPLAMVIGWIFANKFFGHLIPTILYAAPCVLPAWVIGKIHANDVKVRRIALWVMCAVTVLLITVYAIFSEEANWWSVIHGLIGSAIVFKLFESMD